MPTSTNLLSAWHVLPARSMVMVPHLPVHQSAPVTMPPRIFVIFSQIVTWVTKFISNTQSLVVARDPEILWNLAFLVFDDGPTLHLLEECDA